MPHISCLPSYFVSRHTTLQGKETCGKRKKETKYPDIDEKGSNKIDEIRRESEENEMKQNIHENLDISE